MTLHPAQASPAVAEEAFAFLTTLGFTLDERWITGGETNRDGWCLTWSGPIQLVVQYMDAQFEVHFVRGDLDVSYLEIDRDLHGRRSGFHGDMFPPEKLEAAVRRIATDIRDSYEAVLSGDEREWKELGALRAPRRP